MYMHLFWSSAVGPQSVESLDGIFVVLGSFAKCVYYVRESGGLRYNLVDFTFPRRSRFQIFFGANDVSVDCLFKC